MPTRQFSKVETHAQGVLEEVTLLQEITEAARTCVRAFVEDRTDADGLVSTDSFANFARMAGLQAQPWEAALKVCFLHVSHASRCQLCKRQSLLHSFAIFACMASLQAPRWEAALKTRALLDLTCQLRSFHKSQCRSRCMCIAFMASLDGPRALEET